MVFKQDSHFAEAIYFFEDNQVIKEILMVEFEAVLDNVVGIPEFRNSAYRAAYITVGPYLTLKSVVLFHITFDQDGHVVKEWNIPLRELARDAVKGPDLGQGNILRVTRETCRSEYKNELWSAGQQEVALLTAIRDAVKRNKLGIYDGGDRRRYGTRAAYRGVPDYNLGSFDESVTGADLQQDLIVNIEATLKYKYEAQIKQLCEHRDELLRQLEAQLDALRKKNDELHHQLRLMETQNKEQVNIIAGKYKDKMGKELAGLHERLDAQVAAKELELHYSQEQTRQLQEELQSLKEGFEEEKKAELLAQQLDLLNSGVEMIVSQPGIGSYSLKLEQIQSYLDNPTGFWAKQCGVSEAHYLAWYQHYQEPLCQAGKSAGCACNADISRVNNPRDFVLGYSEMCQLHRLKQSKDAVRQN